MELTVAILIVVDVVIIALLLYYSRQQRKCNIENTVLLLSNKNLQNDANAAEEILKAKKDLLSRLGREIRTPLNAIIGFSDLLMGKDNLDETTMDGITKIYDSGSLLLSFVDDMSDISSMDDNKKIELNHVDYDTPSLINSIISLNIIRMETKLIKFELDVDKNLPSRLLGDDLRIKLLFNNVFSNIFRYAVEGDLTWKISYHSGDNCIWLTSSISYTGVCLNTKIDEDDPLGINIAKRIVESMGGSMILNNEPGKGIFFTLKLKQELKEETPIGENVVNNLRNFDYSIKKKEKKAKIDYTQMPPVHILIVDDMPVNLDVARSLIMPYGIHIDTAMSGKIAIAKMMMGSNKYSAIFMDHIMPEMDGVETVRRIRELGSDYAKNIPIIVLTANVVSGNEEMFLKSGFNDFLSKPIDIIKLDAILKKWIKAP